MFFRSLVLGIIAVSLSACNLSGSTQKGPFKAGSTVTVTRLNGQATPILSSKLTSHVVGRQGSYSFNRIRWNGWTELQVSGQYFNEFTGVNSSNSLTLNAITKKNRRFDTANVHLFSHLAAARMRQRVANGQNRNRAWKATQADMKRLFGLPSVKNRNINRGVEQLSLLRGSGRYRKDNANLLLFTGSFLATSGDAVTLQALAEDFADDAQFNGVAADAFHAIAVKAGTAGLLRTLSQNLKNHGARNPPNNGDMSRLPKWVIEDAGDTTPPVITVLGEGIVEVEEGTVYVDFGATAFDDTDGDIIAEVLDGSDNVDTSTAGTSHIVTYTATDAAGNSTTAIRTVNIIEATVVDVTAPVITISGQNPITIVVGTPYVDEGATALDDIDGEVAAVAVDASDVIDTSSITTHTVTYKAVDIAGNEATATREVNVVEAPDTEAPVIVLLGSNPDTVEVDRREVPVLYADSGYTATDNRDESVDVEVLGLDLIDVSVLDASYTVTYTATDVAGNTVTEEREVKVVDTTAPVITVDGANPIDVEAGSSFEDVLGATANDNALGEFAATANITAVNTSELGTYEVVYTAVDGKGNQAEPKTRTINVVDTTAPVITLEGDNPLELYVGDAYVEAGATATDFIKGTFAANADSTAVNMSAPATYKVFYSAQDGAGNIATSIERTVIVSIPPDTTPPQITINGANPETTEAGIPYVDNNGATAIDNVDPSFAVAGDITEVNTSVIGDYFVTYTARDIAGNDAVVVKRMVQVRDSIKPVITRLGDASLVIQKDSTYTDAGATANDNFEGNITADIVVGNPVDTSNPATYTVTYNVSDPSGNAAAQVTRSVRVNAPPIANAGADVSALIGTPVTLVGSGADADGTVVAYQWQREGVNIPSATASTFSYTPEASEVLSLVVTDNNGATASDVVSVEVTLPPPYQIVFMTDITSVPRNLDAGLFRRGLLLMVSVNDGSGNPIEEEPTFEVADVDLTISGTYPMVFSFTDPYNRTITKTLTVLVANSSPIAVGQSITLDEDTVSDTIVLTATDSNVGDTLTYSISSPPSHGVLSGQAPNVVYTPVANYFGADSFEFTVSDGEKSSTATVNITVNDVAEPNQTPVANAQIATVDEDSQNNVIVLSGLDPDGDNNALIYAISTNPLHGTLSGTAPNIKYTPVGNYDGTDEFYFTVNDGVITSSPAKVFITVNSINDLPVVNAGTDITVRKGAVVTLNGSATDDGTITAYRWASTVGNFEYATTASFEFDTSNKYTGDVYLRLTVTDNEGGSGSDVIKITILPALTDPAEMTFLIDLPVVIETGVHANRRAFYDYLKTQIVVLDQEGNTHNNADNNYAFDFEGYSGPVGTTVEDWDSFDPNVAGTGKVTINYLNQYGEGIYDIEVDVVINQSQNSAPIANTQDLITVEEDSSNTAIRITGTDVDNDPLTFAIDTSPSNGTLAGEGQNYTYTPNANYHGSDSFVFTVSDAAHSSSATININVSSVNDAPTADAGRDKTVDVNSSVLLAGSGIDIDGTIETYQWYESGTPLVNANSALFNYRPTTEGTHTLTLTVTDNEGASASDVVEVEATPVIDTIPTEIVFTGGLRDPLHVDVSLYSNYDDLEEAELLDSNYNPKALLLDENGDEYLGGDYFIDIEPVDTLPSGEPVYFDPSVAGEYQLRFSYFYETRDGLPPTIIEKILTVMIIDDGIGNQSSPISGRVVSTDNVAVENVMIRMLSNGAEMFEEPLNNFITNGVFNFGMPSDTGYTIVLSAPGYAVQILVIKTPADAQPLALGNIIMQAKGTLQAVSVGTPATGENGAKVTLLTAAFTDSQGNAVPIDNVQLTITPVDISTPTGLAVFPGEFSGIVVEGDAPLPIVSYGTVEYEFTLNGEVVKFAGEAEIEIPLYTTTHQNGNPIALGDLIPLWSLNEDTGIWEQEGTGVVVASSSATGFALKATVTHFTWWNADAFMEVSYALVTVTAPNSGIATVRVRSNIGWSLGNVNTAIVVGNTSGALPIPSNTELCFSAEVSFTNGSHGVTTEQCETAVTGATVNISLEIVDEPMALATNSNTSVSTYINVPTVPISIRATTPETNVAYVIESGVLPAGVTMTTVDSTITTIAGTPTEAGVFSFVVKGTNADGETSTLSINYSVIDGVAAPNLVPDRSIQTSFHNGREHSNVYRWSATSVTFINSAPFRYEHLVDMYRANKGGVVTNWSVSNIELFDKAYEEAFYDGEISIDPTTGTLGVYPIDGVRSVTFDVIATNALGSSSIKVEFLFSNPNGGVEEIPQ